MTIKPKGGNKVIINRDKLKAEHQRRERKAQVAIHFKSQINGKRLIKKETLLKQNCVLQHLRKTNKKIEKNTNCFQYLNFLYKMFST